ncbi:hypothetical protein TGP89_418990 [Toxoplasma gondii p89]|uniref:Uncharacterized protein n=1 Tax=Toxoplasma gondii p89 TaxID=943119 RepID=A0A086KSG9_TOXGO|nr:hypothetical protein TGP89_418990 [Toxoplasma gondii p89]
MHLRVTSSRDALQFELRLNMNFAARGAVRSGEISCVFRSLRRFAFSREEGTPSRSGKGASRCVSRLKPAMPGCCFSVSSLPLCVCLLSACSANGTVGTGRLCVQLQLLLRWKIGISAPALCRRDHRPSALLSSSGNQNRLRFVHGYRDSLTRQ